MKIISFNVNGLRARPHQMQRLVETQAPDIIGLQETKVHDDQFPVEMIEELGYQAHYFGQKGHYGVALLSKITPLSITRGFPGDDEDAQRRIITGKYISENGKEFTVINGYFPQGESEDHPTKFPAKKKFYDDLLNHLIQDYSPEQALVVMGDINISPQDIDIGIGEENRKRWLKTGKCSFLPEERGWFERLTGWGLIDTFRHKNQLLGDSYSWFDYRSRGFDDNPKRGLRIDLVMATKLLNDCCTQVGIDYDIRAMEKPSDHCPIWAEFKI